jgi:hypothetical protein
MPREFAVIANPLLFVTVGGFCDVHVHTIFWMDMLVVPFSVKQLQKVGLLLACVLAVSLG